MADSYEGPIEDEAFLRIECTKVPGNKALSKKLIEGVMQTVDVAYAEEWKFDHGISVPLHFLTPDSGRINEEWDREFLRRWSANDREALLSYTDAEIYHEGGQGGFEIRTFITAAAAAQGAKGTIEFCEPVPIFAVNCTIARMQIAA